MFEIESKNDASKGDSYNEINFVFIFPNILNFSLPPIIDFFWLCKKKKNSNES